MNGRPGGAAAAVAAVVAAAATAAAVGAELSQVGVGPLGVEPLSAYKARQTGAKASFTAVVPVFGITT